MTAKEKLLLSKVRGALYPARELREELGIDESLLTFIMRKSAKEAPYEVKAVGKGKSYHIDVDHKSPAKLQGRGLVSWLRYVNVFGNLVLYDESKVPEGEVVSFLQHFGYWLSEEGRRRQRIGEVWEEYVEKFFTACDRQGLWQLRVLEHRRNWRWPQGREYDHVYVCELGPKELNITLYVVFECKAGIISVADIDIFYQRVVNEPEFRNFATGGLKSNMVLCMIAGKTCESTAFKKAAHRGIRVILHTSLEDVLASLTGQRKVTFHKIVKAATAQTA